MRYRRRLIFATTLVASLSAAAAMGYGTAASSWTGAQVTALACCCTAVCLAAAAAHVTEVVTTGNEILIERFGKYHRKLGAGLHFVCKPIDRVSFRCQLREQLLDVPPQQCYTVDNAPVSADAVVYLRIVDAHKACYAVVDINASVQSLVLTKIREQVSLLTLDESLTSRDRINHALLQDLNRVVGTWGVVITRVEVQDLQPSGDILQAMELQMSAERKKRAAILRSEGDRATLVNTAEGRAAAALAEARAEAAVVELMATAEANRLRAQAQGWKAALATVAEATGAVDAALQLLLWKQYMDAQAALATSNATKAVLVFPTKDSIPLTHSALQGLMR